MEWPQRLAICVINGKWGNEIHVSLGVYTFVSVSCKGTTCEMMVNDDVFRIQYTNSPESLMGNAYMKNIFVYNVYLNAGELGYLKNGQVNEEHFPVAASSKYAMAFVPRSGKFIKIEHLKSSTVFSIGFWVMVEKHAKEEMILYSFGNHGMVVVLQYDKMDAKTRMVVKVNALQIKIMQYEVPIQEWHHLYMVQNGTALQVYKNGVLQVRCDDSW